MAEQDTTPRAKRAYHSPRREQQAADHRRVILTVARRLFSQHGYAGTTLEAIADAAGLSPKTVVAQFGSKRGILAEILNPVGLDSSHAEVIEQIRAASDPRTRLTYVARLIRAVYTEGATEFELLRGASGVAPELAELSRTVERRRWQQQAGLIAFLRGQGVLRPDRTDEEATAELWAVSSFDLFRLLVLEIGWTPQRYETWLADLLVERLLAS